MYTCVYNFYNSCVFIVVFIKKTDKIQHISDGFTHEETKFGFKWFHHHYKSLFVAIPNFDSNYWSISALFFNDKELFGTVTEKNCKLLCSVVNIVNTIDCIIVLCFLFWTWNCIIVYCTILVFIVPENTLEYIKAKIWKIKIWN